MAIKEIKKINRESVTQQIFLDLKERILAEEFSPGEKLPSENVLSETYGVSRLSTRTALQKLSVLGLVDVRVGEGTFVKEKNFGNLMNEVSEMIAHISFAQYLYEFRDNIEKTCTNLAIQRASEEEMQRFVDLAHQLTDVAKEEDNEKYIEHDYQYHLYLCKMSQNKLYEMVYSSIKDLFKLCIRENIEKTAKHYTKGLAQSALVHLSFSEAMQKRDKQNALILIDTILNKVDASWSENR